MSKVLPDTKNKSTGNVTVFTVIIHPAPDVSGYWAECPELQGCNTDGATLREIGVNMYEAVDLCLEDHPEPICDYILAFEVRDA